MGATTVVAPAAVEEMLGQELNVWKRLEFEVVRTEKRKDGCV